MTQQRLENRFFYGMWVVALISAIAATALKNNYGEVAILLPIVIGSLAGILAAIISKIRARKEAAKDAAASLTVLLNDQQILERQQAYFATAVLLARSLADEDLVDPQACKTFGLREQPRARFLGEGRLVTAG